MQILFPHWFIHTLERLDEILLLQRHAHLLLKLLQVGNVFEPSLILEFASHGHVGRLSADVGDVSSAESLCLLDDEVEIKVFLEFNIFQMNFKQLSSAFLGWQRDVYSLL